MPKSTRKLFILTDGGRARFVVQTPNRRGFVTIEEMDQTHDLRNLRRAIRAKPATSVHDSHGAARHSVDHTDSVRAAKERFLEKVVKRAVEVLRGQEIGASIIAAPPRLIGPLRALMANKTVVEGGIGKDLTKVPDSELDAWLDKPWAAAT